METFCPHGHHCFTPAHRKEEKECWKRGLNRPYSREENMKRSNLFNPMVLEHWTCPIVAHKTSVLALWSDQARLKIIMTKSTHTSFPNVRERGKEKSYSWTRQSDPGSWARYLCIWPQIQVWSLGFSFFTRTCAGIWFNLIIWDKLFYVIPPWQRWHV